jgi:nucleotide-binding universal stress UspA family protein
MEHQGAVVVGLGTADHGIAELDWAAREAQARRRPLHIVRAYHKSQAALPWESMTDRSITSQLRRFATRSAGDALSHVRAHWPDVEVEATVVDGVSAEVMRDATRTAGVTVLGSRHLAALGSVLLGSVSTVVAAAGSGPVVVVSGPPGDAAANPEVVVGIDGAEDMDDVLEFAFDYARRHARPLHAVFCWSPDLLAAMQWRPVPPVPERANRWLAEAVAGWQEKFPDVVVRRGVFRETPAAGLVKVATGQDLLVVGGHSRHARVAALLGSVSQGVLHHATCPVAVVHHRAD